MVTITQCVGLCGIGTQPTCRVATILLVWDGNGTPSSVRYGAMTPSLPQ